MNFIKQPLENAQSKLINKFQVALSALDALAQREGMEVSWVVEVSKGEITCQGKSVMFIWVFPNIMVPPNHPLQ